MRCPRYSANQVLSKMIFNNTREVAHVRTMPSDRTFTGFRQCGVALASPHKAAMVTEHPAQDLLPALGGAPHQAAHQRQGHQGHRSRRDRSRGCAASPGRTENLMARNEIRPTVKLRSTAGTGYTYVTKK